MNPHIAILRTGLVVSVGLSAPAACAAIRAGTTNPTESRILDSSGEWIMAQQVPLEQPWRGTTRLAQMAVMAIVECLADIPSADRATIPLLLCVAENDRPGRLERLDDELFAAVRRSSGIGLSAESRVISYGRVGVGIALLHARRLIAEKRAPAALIVASDTMLNWQTLKAYDREQRVLTATNSNGFIPGEGAGALLVGSDGAEGQLQCIGLGFATEQASINSGEPLRAEGLTQAIRNALQDAGCEMHDLDLRIADLSGEQYYFKEAALAVARTLRVRKEEFDIWHPAQCIGETGAVAGLATLTVAEAACRKGYAPGSNILCHAANDSGQRVAVILRFRPARGAAA